MADTNHFHSIISITGFLSVRLFCEDCFKPHDRKDHCCKTKCKSCFKSGQCNGDQMSCIKCKRLFHGNECFNNHLKTCKIKWQCTKCNRCYNYKDRKKDGHKCCEKRCGVCQVYYQKNNNDIHKCYIQKEKPKLGNDK